MSIHYQDDRVTLYAGNCLDVMKGLDDQSVDAIVTDPPYELGFMGKSWDASGIAFNVDVWREALRVLKPGGHLLAFSGSRTYHRMAVAIEDAGFEIRDQIQWIYSSGFPKSLDVSKAIDKAAGAKREVLGTYRGATNIGMGDDYITTRPSQGQSVVNITAPATDAAKQWQGWGTALKPAHEPVVLARRPLIGTVANTVLTHGTGAINIDGTRVGSEGGTTRVGESTHKSPSGAFSTGHAIAELNARRWPANVIHDGSEEVTSLFPNTGKSGVAVNRNRSGMKPNEVNDGGWGNLTEDVGYTDGGSASRFFYCAKANKRDRNDGLDDAKNHHPTVKPTELMRYLVRMVTPPQGVVLDPFLGSGSTGKAAMLEGNRFIGIELTEEYLPIALARIQFAQSTPLEELLFPADFARPEIDLELPTTKGDTEYEQDA